MRLPQATLLLLTVACATTSSSTPAGGPYRHPSGLEFPAQVNGLDRKGVRVYDQQGLDVSASYTCQDGQHPLVIDVYVYPGPPIERMASPQEALEASLAHFEAVKREVFRAHQGVQLLGEEQFPMAIKGKEYPALRATFDLQLQGTDLPMRSYVYLVPFVGGRWLVKYRFTHPRSTVPGSEPEVKSFVGAWPGR